jgi:hypothetical protein
MVPHKLCSGTGRVEVLKPCTWCFGTGYDRSPHPVLAKAMGRLCLLCGGRRQISTGEWVSCSQCQGSGQVYEKQIAVVWNPLGAEQLYNDIQQQKKILVQQVHALLHVVMGRESVSDAQSFDEISLKASQGLQFLTTRSEEELLLPFYQRFNPDFQAIIPGHLISAKEPHESRLPAYLREDGEKAYTLARAVPTLAEKALQDWLSTCKNSCQLPQVISYGERLLHNIQAILTNEKTQQAIYHYIPREAGKLAKLRQQVEQEEWDDQASEHRKDQHAEGCRIGCYLYVVLAIIASIFLGFAAIGAGNQSGFLGVCGGVVILIVGGLILWGLACSLGVTLDTDYSARKEWSEGYYERSRRRSEWLEEAEKEKDERLSLSMVRIYRSEQREVQRPKYSRRFGSSYIDVGGYWRIEAYPIIKQSIVQELAKVEPQVETLRIEEQRLLACRKEVEW